MSGKNYLLDTNAVISLLNGNAALSELLRVADWIGISIISKYEFLSFSQLTATQIELFEMFISKVHVVPLTNDDTRLLARAVRLRRENQLKLPDAIIAASALLAESTLVTNDKQLLAVNELGAIKP
jgi:predicted nucleic acid-binding protein